MDIKRALIIRDPWLDLILKGKKRWEMRSHNTNIRGRIGLIRQGSGMIVGEACLADSIVLEDRSVLPEFKDAHRINYKKHPELKKHNVVWVLINVKKFIEPVPYDHPRGAVTWVRL